MNEMEIYQSVDNQIEIQAQFDGETAWLTQDQLVSLFQRDQSVISKHI